MDKQIKNTGLHITNGDSLTQYLRELGFTEPCLTWREMLCEGPLQSHMTSEDFFTHRKAFLNTTYNINENQYSFSEELKLLDHTTHISEINLWFEFDLFCHINLLGAINLIHQKQIKAPLYLVCSGRVKGETQMKGLCELSASQLLHHYEERVHLTQDDIQLAVAVWHTYCGKDHNLLKPYIVQRSNFKYLSNCLKAHLERFPYQTTGLDRLEEHILHLLKDNVIKSKHHLLGYCLNYQGFYGFGELQLQRIIDKLSVFFDETAQELNLNDDGFKALEGKGNVVNTINNNMVYGGVQRLNFQYSPTENKLVKARARAN